MLPLDARNAEQDEIVHTTIETARNHRLVADFKCRAMFVDKFEKALKDYITAHRATSLAP